MKNKKTIITVSIIMVLAAVLLLVNKSSYAAHIPTTNYCAEQVIVTKYDDTIELVEGISLPRTLEVKTPSGNLLDNEALIMLRSNNVYGKLGEKGYESPYPIPVFSNNQEENKYYQQLFLWWMIDNEYQDNVNLSQEEKNQIKTSPNGKAVVKKIEEYEKLLTWSNASNENQVTKLDEINTKNITYYATNDYIETNLIIPDCTQDYSYLFTDYEVKATSPVIVVDEQGKEKTTFQRGEGFKLRIPKSEIQENKISFQAEVIGKSTFDIWAPYYTSGVITRGVASSIYLINCGNKKSTSFEVTKINYNIEVGTLNIKVIDVESKEELKDAQIEIYDNMGNIVYRYTTTGTTLNIQLPVGEYTVKQIITPPNYQARIQEQKVTVTTEGETNTILENIQLIDVPNTGANISNVVIIGIVIILIGTALILIAFKKRKEAK